MAQTHQKIMLQRRPCYSTFTLKGRNQRDTTANISVIALGFHVLFHTALPAIPCW